MRCELGRAILAFGSRRQLSLLLIPTSKLAGEMLCCGLRLNFQPRFQFLKVTGGKESPWKQHPWNRRPTFCSVYCCLSALRSSSTQKSIRFSQKQNLICSLCVKVRLFSAFKGLIFCEGHPVRLPWGEGGAGKLEISWLPKERNHLPAWVKRSIFIYI